MRRILVIAGLLLLNTLLQTVIWPEFSFWQSYPDFLLVTVVAFALLEGGVSASIIGMCGGLLLDSFSGPLGLMALVYLLIGQLAGLLFYRKVYVDGFVVPTLISIGFCIPWLLVQVIALLIGGWQVQVQYYLLRHFFPALLGTALLAPAVFQLIKRLHKCKWMYKSRYDYFD